MIEVTPVPTDEELAAIMAANEVLWPRPLALSPTRDQPTRWRFSGRWWSEPPARRRSRP